ncbi:MAG: hypothetical protein V1725_08210 [archaeon]
MNLSTLKKEVVDVYEEYLSGGKTPELCLRARELHVKYCTASPILPSDMFAAIMRLIDIAVDTHVPPPDADEVKRILHELRTLSPNEISRRECA